MAAIKKKYFSGKAGSLSTLSTHRLYPKIEKVGIKVNKWEEEELTIYYGTNDLAQKNMKYWSRLALYHVSHFYDYEVSEEDADNMTSRKLARSLVGMLLSLGDAESIIKGVNLESTLNLVGIDPDFRRIDKNEVKLLRSHHYQGLMEDLEATEELGKILSDKDYCIVIMAVIILCMVKHVNEDNAEKWVKNRLKTFSGSVGNSDVLEIWEDLRPYTKYLSQLQSFMSANFDLRKSCFLIILEISQQSTATSETLICRDIVQLRKRNHHLVLIDNYIFKKYRELQGFYMIADIAIHQGNALKTLQQEENDNVMYIKLLRISDCITGYLTMRSRRLATVRIGEMEAAYLGPNYETDLYFDQVIKEYHLSNQVEEEEDTIAPKFRSITLVIL